MQEEAFRQVGGGVLLTEPERRLSERLHKLKEQEMAGPQFPPAMHFFKARSLIQQSPIFRLLQMMPKGAALHIHTSSLVGVDWLVKNVTYRPHCYVCFTADQSVRFIFSAKQPIPQPGCSKWTLLETLRRELGNVTGFDRSLMQNLTLFTADPETTYPSQNVVWSKFEQTFSAVSGLLRHAPVFKDYLYQGLTQLYQDNIIYTYELDGSTHDKSWCLRTYQEVSRKFAAQHPDFLGARVIFTVRRNLSASKVREAVQSAITLHKEFPEVMVGFDLVGHEDTGRPLWYFREALSLPMKLGVTLAYFFHAGETVLMSEGHPLVISSDDPAAFGTTGLSYDFYEMFVGIGGMSSNLGTLKELAINSLRYSSLSPQQKEEALTLWQKKWDKFVYENL
ncbi:hypothetical protein Z043_110116 [Scleropages formosus]|uniref:adenosine deaminase n=1 Tax=Scleropages formosus TaxID=113540 RepID=A0A0P7X915_SCLFO|nr:hypothetical protein Z043_110116 [Scleropages formosus]